MESIGFTCKTIFSNANFHVLGLFVPRKKIRLSRGVAGVVVRALVEICIGDISAALTTTDLRFRLPSSFGLD
jgi:hypothetical protein